jgi:hypothetical protein
MGQTNRDNKVSDGTNAPGQHSERWEKRTGTTEWAMGQMDRDNRVSDGTSGPGQQSERWDRQTGKTKWAMGQTNRDNKVSDGTGTTKWAVGQTNRDNKVSDGTGTTEWAVGQTDRENDFWPLLEKYRELMGIKYFNYYRRYNPLTLFRNLQMRFFLKRTGNVTLYKHILTMVHGHALRRTHIQIRTNIRVKGFWTITRQYPLPHRKGILIHLLKTLCGLSIWKNHLARQETKQFVNRFLDEKKGWSLVLFNVINDV